MRKQSDFKFKLEHHTTISLVYESDQSFVVMIAFKGVSKNFA